MKPKLITVSLMSVLSISVEAATMTVYSPTIKVGSTYTNFNVPKWDANYGTVTGVTIFVTSQLTGSITISSAGNISTTVSAFDSALTVRSTDAASSGFSTKTDIIEDVSTTPSWTTATLAPSTSQVFTFSSGQLFSFNSTYVASDKLSYYIGSGAPTDYVTFQARNLQSVTVSGDELNLNSSNAGSNTQFGITYTYEAVTAVPEASSLITVAGLVSCGILSRRRVIRPVV